MLARVTLSLALLGAAAPATVGAAMVPAPPTGSASVPAPDELWATVNVCDTARHPGEVGVRAAMPGRPRGAARRMRFRLHWLDGDRWRYVEGADSDWRRLSVARGRVVEHGWSFEFAPPARPITFRGVVRFQWLEDGRIVRRARELTETGHRSTVGADPAGYSAASCSIA
jgi:hypothetical protein